MKTLRNIPVLKPVFYSLCWLKAVTQVVTQRAIMMWMFYFNPRSNNQEQF